MQLFLRDDDDDDDDNWVSHVIVSNAIITIDDDVRFSSAKNL